MRKFIRWFSLGLLVSTLCIGAIPNQVAIAQTEQDDLLPGIGAIPVIEDGSEGPPPTDAEVANPEYPGNEPTPEPGMVFDVPEWAESSREPGDYSDIENETPSLNMRLLLPSIQGGDIARVAEAEAVDVVVPSPHITGDFNGDGFADMAVSVGGEDIGSVNSAGAFQIIYGSEQGLSATGNQFWSQSSSGVPDVVEAGDIFGDVLAAGNFNGDAYTDLAVSAPGEELTIQDQGVVYIFYGSATGLTATGVQLWRQGANGLAGTAESIDKFGSSLVTGRFNSDIYFDLAIAVREEDIEYTTGVIDNAGAVHVIYGSASGLTATGNQLFTQDTTGIVDAAESGDLFGDTLAAGDFDKNGTDDLAIGVPSEDFTSPDRGIVHILYSTASGLGTAGSEVWHQDVAGIPEVAETGDSFGDSLAAGDFNKDGYVDLAVAASLEDFGTVDFQNKGVVHVIYGSSTGLGTSLASTLFSEDTIAGAGAARSNDAFGTVLAGADLNADGYSDLAIGVPYDDFGTTAIENRGSVYILRGGSSGLTKTGYQRWHQDVFGILDLAESGDFFGYNLLPGDFDRNGVVDLGMSAVFEDLGAGKDSAGQINVLYSVPTIGLVNVGDQVWSQDSAGIGDVAEDGDFFK